MAVATEVVVARLAASRAPAAAAGMRRCWAGPVLGRVVEAHVRWHRRLRGPLHSQVQTGCRPHHDRGDHRQLASWATAPSHATATASACPSPQATVTGCARVPAAFAAP